MYLTRNRGHKRTVYRTHVVVVGSSCVRKTSISWPRVIGASKALLGRRSAVCMQRRESAVCMQRRESAGTVCRGESLVEQQSQSGNWSCRTPSFCDLCCKSQQRSQKDGVHRRGTSRQHVVADQNSGRAGAESLGVPHCRYCSYVPYTIVMCYGRKRFVSLL